MSDIVIYFSPSAQSKVSVGNEINCGDLLAEENISTKIYQLPIGKILAIKPRQITSFLTKKPGEVVEKDEQIAQKPIGFLKKKKKTVNSPVSGKIISIEGKTGIVNIAYDYLNIKILSPGKGEVKKIEPGEITISFLGSEYPLEQGRGGTEFGEIFIVTNDCDLEVDPLFLNESLKDKILFGGIWGGMAMAKAKAVGAKAIIGCIFQKDYFKIDEGENLNLVLGKISKEIFEPVKNHHQKKAILSIKNNLLCLLKP